MKATRRGFFGLFPGAVLGGKQALAKSAEQLALGVPGDLLGESQVLVPAAGQEWSRKQLRRLLDPKYLRKRKRETGVRLLDPDLACQHSRSLSSRILEQKERNFQRELESEKSGLQLDIEGFFD